jgi:Mrp family chromosome partitioning ATPase
MLLNQSPEDKFQVLLLSKLASPGADVPTGPVSAPVNEAVLKKILAELRARFEFIILDSPPLPSVADGMTLGLFADLILSVVSVARTNRRSFERHCNFLELLNRPHGIVINYVELQKDYRGSTRFDLSRRDEDTLLQ